MQALITSYLVQKKECNLPLLGHFRIKSKPADFEKADKQIFPPTDEILYSEFAATLSPDLITYIASVHGISREDAELKINAWCNDAREQLNQGEKINFTSLGSLQKGGAGNIFFQRKQHAGFFDPVSADRIVHQNTEHTVLVGDMETTSSVMNEYFREEGMGWKRAWWKIWAIVMLCIALITLALYFYTHDFSVSGMGNQAPLPVKDPPVLHQAP